LSVGAGEDEKSGSSLGATGRGGQVVSPGLCKLDLILSQVNTLVVGPGQYRFGDFAKIGAPFAVIVSIVSVLLVPVFPPFS
jgi:uncharacterized membrane protein